MTTTVWIDGQVMDAAAARVGALDHGLTVGDGVFETCKVLHGEVFALTRHLRRLARSAAVLGLACPTAEVVREATTQLISAREPLPLGRLRITLTGGAGPLGSDRGDAPPTLVLALSAAAPWPDRIAAVTVPWTRNEHSAVAGAKTTSYAENVVALQRAHDQGAHEALLPNTAGNLCEGTGSNVVLDLDGVLVTPPLGSGCLAGITRELFLEWAVADGLPVLERDVPIEALGRARDVLLTSSTRNVQQVQTLDGRPVPGSALGRSAVELFERYAAKGMDP
ncbi:MAG: aminotransferase class IV [Kineosporiaceae bacterium]